jgi:integrase
MQTFTVAAVAAWRDHLQAQGLAPSSIAQRVCAVRRLAAAMGADPLVAQVRCTQVQHARPRALSDRELSALLARPDLRTTIGVRDRAILELLARAGLRRSELARLTLTDVQERGRQPDKRRRPGDRPKPGRADPARARRPRRETRADPHRPAARPGTRRAAALVCGPTGGRH